MILKNTTNGNIITENLTELKSFKSKSLGLLDKTNGKNIFLKTRFGIHTFFMRESIDVLILNGNMEVVKVHENLKPNRIFLWNPIFDNVVELENGLIASSQSKLKDKINLLP